VLLVNVDVDDLSRGIAFYERGLGLRLRRRLFGGKVAELEGAAAPIFLIEKPEGSAASAAAPTPRRYARHWTPVHLEFAVEDLGAAVERAEAAGARVERPAQRLAWGRIAVLADPFGHGFCLIQFEGRGYGEVESG